MEKRTNRIHCSVSQCRYNDPTDCICSKEEVEIASHGKNPDHTENTDCVSFCSRKDCGC